MVFTQQLKKQARKEEEWDALWKHSPDNNVYPVITALASGNRLITHRQNITELCRGLKHMMLTWAENIKRKRYNKFR